MRERCWSAASPAHSQPAPTSSRAQTATQPACGSRNSAAPNPASSAAAVRTRAFSIAPSAPARNGLCDPPSAGLRLLDLIAGASEATLALLVPLDRRVELGSAEIRPEGRGEIQLRVRELPQQEIADALLASGA